MNVDALVTRLGAVSELGQVVTATPGGSISPFDASSEIYTLLGSLVSNRVYPVTAQETQTKPHIVYQQLGNITSKLEGFRIMESATFALFIAHTTYDDLQTLVTSVVSALDGSTYAVEVLDMMMDYNDDERTFICSMEIDFTTLTAAAQTLPAAFVYCIGRTAQPSITDNLVNQLVSNEYAIVVMNSSDSSPVQEMDTILNAIKTSLIGWQQTTAHHEMEYVSGQSIEGVGGLQIWREIYSDAEYFRQS